ncbi:AMP-dependent synthetase/ligase [Fischerella thermalis]|uniref:Long-chain-fatty-acid--CoA ligase., o-succinylbenzoate--CoA ligase n=1 Tax=Fischerella thermalis JSC-11 TaxID=741277 RepID=G6FSQ0_9CYAN|nr:AMP-binding protein [Fischerella thermalis]EHC14886.1 Long-chain-fatty-acid--CoA ligase., o-succinylbenzoate--CoA ligase [Fischerella thermalis JSC-11]PLZ14566.1 long-chain fatty acid--CoA ligase [Fischerella thermalis WC119]PLZ15026.1 long-chain fatty acid--CoA ligase [Fischerella thermalis WC114]PLZ24663.1 long-chain fatty acid--CoA ligase [Fischerella thermalis WC157]PLZ29099.1 long-chain fatty acid--CoA ligase [Fischerella thermalis WC341]
MLCTNQIYKAPPNSGQVVLGRTLPSLLDEACDRTPNSRAFNQFTQTGWQALSNHEFRTAVTELALGLLNLQLKAGDCIALLMHSDVNFCIADMGSLLAGLVNVPIDLTQTIEHIIFILQHTEAKALIISDLDLLSQIIPYLQNASNLQAVIVADVSIEWYQRRQQLTCQQSGEKDQIIPENLCLSLPTSHLPAAAQSAIDLPQCIQVFSVEEIRSQGREKISEFSFQELNTKLIANNLATIIYIPGTTGEPQGVMLTHENLSANAVAMFTGIPNLGLGTEEIVLSFLPLTHVFARVLVYGHIKYGHSIYFSNSHRILKHLQEVKPTIFATVPLLLEKIYHKLLEIGEKNQKRVKLPRPHITLSSLKFSTNWVRKTSLTAWREATVRLSTTGRTLKTHLTSARRFSVPLSQSVMNWAIKIAQKYELGKIPQRRYALMLKLADRLVFYQWRAVFGSNIKYLISGGAALKAEIANLFAAAGMKILQGYGLTETSSAVTCNRGQFNRAGTVGVAIAGVEITIAEDGEILTRSPYITQGYYKNSQATQQLIDAEGWLHTGDLGEFTSDGFLKITGLKKSRFKLSTGKYVTPQPIESRLEKSALITKAVTVGADRKFCAMLIFPNLDNLQQQALSIGIDLPTEELLQHPCIVALYQALVDEANCHLPHWSTVKKFRLINAKFTVENGLLTTNQQVNRTKILEVFAEEINAIYEDKRMQRYENVTIEQMDNLCPVNQRFSCPAFAQSLSS